MDIALATSADFPDLGPHDRAVVGALAELGLVARPLIWSDPNAPWQQAKLAVIQSTWDSHFHPPAFLAWAERVAESVPLHNPAPIVRWNLHKGYLRDLQDKGVSVTPTVWLKRGQTLALQRLMREQEWPRVVLKPAVSAGAHETHVIDGYDEVAQSTLERLSAMHDLMIQPYLSAFESEGERSYIFFDGVLSHAVHRPPTLKSAARGYSEPSVFAPQNQAELDLAHAVIAAINAKLLYARVDVATNNDGVVRLQEVELVEPSLFTSLAPGSVQKLARAIAARL